MLQHQDSGVTPKTPVEMLEAQIRSRGFRAAPCEASTPSPDPEDRRADAILASGKASKKRRLHEAEAEEPPRFVLHTLPPKDLT